jgi:ribonuclease E
VNSGRATKEGSIEDTAYKTNMEAAEEVARQLRLRDLAGLIVIDFIDMEERKNNAAVEKKLKDKLKTDRARIQVGRISGFGLLEMSRQRLRPGMLEATTAPCPHCHGTGLIRSEDSLALTILRQLEEEGTRKRSREVLLKAPVAIVNFLMNQKREHIAGIELRYGMAVRVEADPFLISPDFSIEKFKTAIRVVPEAPVVSGNTAIMAEVDEDEDLVEDIVEEDDDEVAVEAEAQEERRDRGPRPAASGPDGAPGKKKRRRRRRKKGGSGQGPQVTNGESDEDLASYSPPAPVAAPEPAAGPVPEPVAEPVAAEAAKPKPKPRVTRASSSRKPKAVAVEAEAETPVETPVETPAEAGAEPASKPARKAPARKPAARKTAAKPKAEAEAPAEVVVAEVAALPAPAPKPARAAKPRPDSKPEPEPETVGAGDAGKPKKKGWWSLGR